MHAITIALLLQPFSHAQDAQILMLGNSYTQFNDLQSLVAGALVETVPAWSEVDARRLTRGGWTLADHAAEADGSSGDTEWSEALVSGPEAGSWDQVILQDQSQVPGFPTTETSWIASRDGAVILDGLIGDGAGETVFLLTWGRRDGDSGNPDIYPDFTTMQDRLLEGYLAYSEACTTAGEVAWIIPAGLSFQQVHDEILAAGGAPTDPSSAFYALYSGDGSHPSLAGSWLAALTAAATLTGRSVAQVPAPGELDGDLADTLRPAADALLAEPFGDVAYRWAHDWDDWQSPQDVSAEGTAISGLVQRPLVRVAADAGQVQSLALGAEHADGQQGEGRLLVTDGGGLQITTMSTLGDSALLISGGSLEIASGSLPPTEHSGGRLRLGGSVDLLGDLTGSEQAELELVLHQLQGPWLDISGDATLAGTLIVQLDQALQGDDAGQVELVRAATLELDTALQTELPAGCEIQLHHYDDGDVLVLSWSACDLCDTGSAAPETCGCAAGGVRSSGIMAGLLLLGLKRRSPSGARTPRCRRPSAPTGSPPAAARRRSRGCLFRSLRP